MRLHDRISARWFTLALVFLLIFPEVQSDDSGAGPQCYLVANFDMHQNRPVISVITATSQPYPVVYDVESADDSLVSLTLHLPYTWPTRAHEVLSLSSRPGQSVLCISCGGEQARFIVKYLGEPRTFEVETQQAASFIEVKSPEPIPLGVVCLQLEGEEDRLIELIIGQTSNIATPTTLKAGYYRGIPCLVTVVMKNRTSLNATSRGVMLALKLKSPGDASALEKLQAVADENNVPLFCDRNETGD